ncbi:hypothetical protein [Leifsonia poae]|uniref:hypothetical protein n=1 Tax=Leifsonia poae TaxID=110933 RepID=UPI001CC03F56|nr:hypothetical protein [Leifsonia poae]
MASREQIDALARQLTAEHGDRLLRVRDGMLRLIDAASDEDGPQQTETVGILSPVREGVLCLVSCICIAASEGQPITVIATRVSAVDRHEAEVSPTETEALAFSRALLGDSWFAMSLRDRTEIRDAEHASRGVRLYLSGDFQPGVPEVLGDALVPTVETFTAADDVR